MASDARPAKRHRSTGSRWLVLDDPLKLLAKVLCPPWEDDGDEVFTNPRILPVAWEEATNADAAWAHEIAWISRDGGAVAIHRLRPRGGADTALLASLAAFARAEAAAAPTDAPAAADLQASNVGGYHGDRDLWWRPEFQASPLPALLGGAVTLAARAEAAALGRAPVTTSADEAWLNCLGPGGWNALHTHPGSSYSGAYFVSAGACADDGGDGGGVTSQAAGRLCFVPYAPDTLSAEQLQQHVRPTNGGGGGGGGLGGLDRYLLIDPVPGTAIVFPSFLPHFVLPAPPPRAGAAPEDEARVSVAFNFGATDPVVAHCFTLGGRVKLALETVPTFGL